MDSDLEAGRDDERAAADTEGDSENEHDRGYAVRVGARLRAIRRQKHLSLQEVEANSEHEFKASVLGAYERGERAISVPRLQRLARFYQVPVDQMLPADEDFGFRRASDVVDLTEKKGGRLERPVTIDLTAVEHVPGQEGEMISRYLRMIQVQRGDYNGRMLTIRRDDLRAIACILDCHPDQVPARLTSLGLCLVR